MASCDIGSGSPRATRKLPLDQIDVVDELGDRVLDLQAGVHFEEIELPRPAASMNSDRPGADVVHRLAPAATARRAHARRAARRRPPG
jgi:hypothetical protein